MMKYYYIIIICIFFQCCKSKTIIINELKCCNHSMVGKSDTTHVFNYVISNYSSLFSSKKKLIDAIYLNNDPLLIANQFYKYERKGFRLRKIYLLEGNGLNKDYQESKYTNLDEYAWDQTIFEQEWWVMNNCVWYVYTISDHVKIIETERKCLIKFE